MIRQQQKEAKKKRMTSSRPEIDKEASQEFDALVAMDNKDVASRQKNALHAVSLSVHFSFNFETPLLIFSFLGHTSLTSRELSRRIKKPVDGEDGLKRKIPKLKDEAKVIQAQFEFQQKMALNAEVKVEKLEAALSKLKEESSRLAEERSKLSEEVRAKSGSLEEPTAKLNNPDLGLGELHAKVENLKVALNATPSQIDTAKVEAKMEYRASLELEKDLIVMMNMAISGGYTTSIQESGALFPDLDVSKLESGPFYDLKSKDLYDQYFEVFQQGVFLDDNYAPKDLEEDNPNAEPNPTVDPRSYIDKAS